MRLEESKEFMVLLQSMQHSPLGNYAGLPGLTSHLIAKSDHGCVRTFSSPRYTEEHITPHSHRYDFTCLVLRGYVENTTYDPWCVDDKTRPAFTCPAS